MGGDSKSSRRALIRDVAMSQAGEACDKCRGRFDDLGKTTRAAVTSRANQFLPGYISTSCEATCEARKINYAGDST
jgi:hypothetical protein